MNGGEKRVEMFLHLLWAITHHGTRHVTHANGHWQLICLFLLEQLDHVWNKLWQHFEQFLWFNNVAHVADSLCTCQSNLGLFVQEPLLERMLKSGTHTRRIISGIYFLVGKLLTHSHHSLTPTSQSCGKNPFEVVMFEHAQQRQSPRENILQMRHKFLWVAMCKISQCLNDEIVRNFTLRKIFEQETCRYLRVVSCGGNEEQIGRVLPFGRNCLFSHNLAHTHFHQCISYILGNLQLVF
mmetsp:Transcript_11057/g.41226  ORF Transcript_11057/g.41226 Transcript_11057/m.41226 type:complete len:239 (-) Transcript_11057:490-1206(-)